MSESIDDVLDRLAEEFDILGEWDERLKHVIDLGSALPPLPEQERIEANKVRGCAAQVWLATSRLPDGRLIFRADSDSSISKGNIALLLQLFSGRYPDEIMAFDATAALNRLGLPDALTPQRANGLFSMVQKIRSEALDQRGSIQRA
jgi:cysteine desulfuration protein SufE